MTQVILQPASGPDAQEHYRNTIARARTLVELQPYLAPSDRATLARLCPRGEVRVWGAVGSRNTLYWERMQAGDLVLFYQDGRFVAVATLIHKTQNQSLARYLWSPDKKGRYYEHIFFLDEPRDIDISYEDLQGVAQFGPRDWLPWLEILPPDSSKRVMEAFPLAGTVAPRSNEYEAITREKEYEAIARELDETESLDARRTVAVRREQAFLRGHLFGSRTTGTCAICAREFPIDLLVAAHIKRRADCTEEEKRDYRNNVIPMCKLGCDELFERGYIVVRNGRVLPGPKDQTTEAVKKYVSFYAANKPCDCWTTERAAYFEWHARHATKGDL